MRAVFFGTPAIAVPALDALHELAEVAAAVCQPDRPTGRGLALSAPPVKERARALGIEVAQPEKIRTPEFAAWLRAKRPDFALVMAYGRILPPAALAAPVKGCLNLHASLLPKYRGAAPIQWAVANGERETGISLMQMDEGCDTGPVFARRVLSIGQDETAGGLSPRLASLAAAVVREDLPRALAGLLVAEPQDDARASSAPLLTKADGAVDWTLPARQVHDRARAMTPWPGAHTALGGKRFKLLATRVAEEAGRLGAPGEILVIDALGARVACGQGAILLVRGQVEGKNPLGARELEAGRTIGVGMRFGGGNP